VEHVTQFYRPEHPRIGTLDHQLRRNL